MDVVSESDQTSSSAPSWNGATWAPVGSIDTVGYMNTLQFVDDENSPFYLWIVPNSESWNGTDGTQGPGQNCPQGCGSFGMEVFSQVGALSETPYKALTVAAGVEAAVVAVVVAPVAYTATIDLGVSGYIGLEGMGVPLTGWLTDAALRMGAPGMLWLVGHMITYTNCVITNPYGQC